ncbi:MAG: hypothetical protein A2176_10395 [Spirochaetes bacterium RBG_13_51_14]|nr:MAG: hypothetical protein A2176_10395 [Spirochaetes bacterium RBG_13_51_14]
MEKNVFEKLTCPACAAKESSVHRLFVHKADETGQEPVFFCRTCKARYRFTAGCIDLADKTAAPRILSSQWAMEFRPIIVLYEHIWRPLVTKPFSDLSWEMDTALQLLELSSGHDSQKNQP